MSKTNFIPLLIGKVLEVNEEEVFTVNARDQSNWSGLRVQAGHYYTFHIQDGDHWQVKDIVCGPNGWESEQLPWMKEAVIKTFEDNRRCPSANWFELIGSIGDDEKQDNFFRIADGKNGATYTASQNGELFTFANDLLTMYRNNKGDIDVTVKRVGTPGHSHL